MRFEWTDDVMCSRYECALFDDDNNELADVSFWDYSSEPRVASDEKNRLFREYAYQISCWGSNGHYTAVFDRDADYTNHHGWHGVKEHTVDDIKHWCEKYLASLYIIDYDAELAELNRRKQMSDWFVENGYGNTEEKEEERE